MLGVLLLAVLDDNYLALTALMTLVLQLSFFAIAATFRFDKVTDIAGAINFALIAAVTFAIHQTYTARQIVITTFTLVWSARLGGFLLYRVLRRGKDERFDGIRGRFCSFLGFWIFQMVWVWTVSLPVTFLNAADEDVSIGARDIVGWTLWFVGFAVESVADLTKNIHTENAATRNTFIRDGVWSVSRHPNYFGEICLWVGIFLSSSAVYQQNTLAAYAAVASPVLTAVLLLFVSGAPMAEQRYDQKFGHTEEYRMYKQSTSPIVPLPPRLYAVIPNFIRTALLCEFYPLQDQNKENAPNKPLSPQKRDLRGLPERTSYTDGPLQDHVDA